MHVIGAAQTINCVHEYADWADDERARASAAVAKLIDAVSEVWLQYDAMDDPELGAVVVILENSKQTALAAVPSGARGYCAGVGKLGCKSYCCRRGEL